MAKADWKTCNFSWGLSKEQIRTGREFQVNGAETENTREVKLLVTSEGLARRFVLEEHKAFDVR